MGIEKQSGEMSTHTKLEGGPNEWAGWSKGVLQFLLQFPLEIWGDPM